MERIDSDAELVARTGDGDRDAFARLIDRHKDDVVSYLTRLTGARDRADDLAQETFLRLYHSAPRYAENGHFRGFLFRIATNLARDEARRERRRRLLALLFLATDEADHRPGPQRELLDDETGRAVTAALAELPMHYRVPLVLHELEGWPLEEIAQSLGCAVGTVKSRLARARAKLRDSLASFWYGGFSP